MMKLLAMLAAGIPAIISSILVWFARKATTAAGSIVSFLALVVVFIACQRSIFNELYGILNPPAVIANWIGYFLPGDWILCIGAIISSKICRAAYLVAKRKLHLINSAT